MQATIRLSIPLWVIKTELNSQDTIDREFSPLELIKDNHPKFVVSMDSFFKDNINGIEHRFAGEFLLEKW